MRCARCGAENAPARRFCGGCGAPLAVRCPGCGFANGPGDRFCGGCGAPLARDLAVGTPERRQVAVLFVDLVGYTRLAQELGGEETRALLEAFFGTVGRVVVRYGGTVDKHIGDCVMALFGAPVAKGDDAERAVRAGLAVLDAMPELGARLGRPLAVHAGVACGEVVAGPTGSAEHRAYTVTGDSVNLAARLADLAGPSELLASGAIRLAVGPRLRLEDRGEVAVKGLAAAVRVHRVLGIEDRRPERRGALVGRRAELAQLEAVLARVAATGRGELAVVRGEAGIGKTHLVGEVLGLAGRQGFACHTALVLDFGTGEGRDPLRVLARPLLGAEAAGAVLPAGAPADRLQPFLLELAGLPLPPDARALVDAMDEARRRRSRQEALVALLRTRSAQKPRLLLIEDVHWAEPELLDDLATLAEAAAGLPAVLLLTTRRDGDPLDETWRARAGTIPTTSVELGPLPETEARRLAETIVPHEEEETVACCVARAQGNPLFLEQLLRHLRERQDATAIPGTVQSLVQARVDRLAPEDREALRAAAVLGQRFSLEGLRAVLGDPAYAPDRLVQRHLVQPVGDGYLFGHALIRDAVYDLLLRGRRQELHRRAAAWYGDADPVLRARHLDRAEDPGAAAAHAAAAEHLARAYRGEAALELATRGRELATGDAERCRLTWLQARLLVDLGRAQAGLAAARESLALARSDAERARARLEIAAALRLADRLDEALAELDEAEAAAGRIGDADLLSRVHHARGNLLFPLGRVEECVREHERALAQARAAGSQELEARALGGLGDAEYARGRMLTAHAAFARCCALAAARGLGRIEAANRPMIAITAWYTLDLAWVLREADAAVELALRVGHLRGAIIAHHAAVMTHFLRLDLPNAEARIAEAGSLTAAIGARRFEAENLMFSAEVRLRAGERAEAAEIAERAMRISRETAVTYIGPAILGVIAWSARDAGVRREALAEGEALLGQGALSHNFLWFRRYAIEAALDAGDPVEALRQASALERYTAAAEPTPWSAFMAARGRALASYGRSPGGDPAIRRELTGLRDFAAEQGLRADLAALDAVLADRASVQPP